MKKTMIALATLLTFFASGVSAAEISEKGWKRSIEVLQVNMTKITYELVTRKITLFISFVFTFLNSKICLSYKV